MKKSALIVFCLFASTSAKIQAQGFVNLGFESAQLSSYGTGMVPATNGIPGWSGYVNGVLQTSIIYNDIALDASAVSIQGTNTSIPSLYPIQGRYSVFLQGSSSHVPAGDSAIAQTGQIPITALSLFFWGNVSGLQLSFAGHSLTLLSVGATASYTVYGADISAYAGQTGVLIFNAPALGFGVFDNIQFSSSPVPEPSGLALAALGAMFFGSRLRKKVL